MNTERLEMLAAHLEKLPREEFNMGTWCGTACCIAGHLMSIEGRWRPAHGNCFQWEEYALPVAADLLELSFEDAADLMGCEPHNENATPQQAASVVRHLKDTGKVEWERFVK